MTDEQFERLLRESAPSYNTPPEAPPLEAIWGAIERSWATGGELVEIEEPGVLPLRVAPRRWPEIVAPWLRIAAVLLVGIALGRASLSLGSAPAADEAVTSAATVRRGAPGEDQTVTHQYLGATAALLVALPGELRAQQADPVFASRANDLLLQTRLLLDSPAASDPTLHLLFEDLEVVLAQVVRLQADRDDTRIELLSLALEQSDVMPRLRDAVVERLGD